MSDYNDGLIPEPCLRLDYGFGEEYASIELGDGTGYVRVTDDLRGEHHRMKRVFDDVLKGAMNSNDELRMKVASLEAALEGMHLIREQDKAENDELREMAQKLYSGYMGGHYMVSCRGCEHAYEDCGGYVPLDPDYCMFSDSDRYVGCWKQKRLEAEMRDLGIEVDG